MRHLSFTFLLAASTAVSTLHAQEPKVPERVPPQPVTLTGCVTAGEREGSYLLTHVFANAPVGTSGSDRNVAPPFYWLDSASRLKPHVGHEIEIVGTLTGDVDKTKVKHKDGEMKIEREAFKEVKVPEGAPASATPSGTLSGYKVKVNTIRLLSTKCEPQSAPLN